MKHDLFLLFCMFWSDMCSIVVVVVPLDVVIVGPLHCLL